MATIAPDIISANNPGLGREEGFSLTFCLKQNMPSRRFSLCPL
jgi:hypothetical protein